MKIGWIAKGPLCLYAALLAVLVVKYLFSDDPHRCKALAERGAWLEGPQGPEWRVPGCTLRRYQDVCFDDGEVILAGDSSVRQIFVAVAETVGLDVPANYSKHADLVAQRNNFSLRFMWDPFLNSSFDQVSGERTRVLFFGGGLWHALHDQAHPIEYDSALSKVKDLRKASDAEILMAPPQTPHYASLDELQAKHITPSRVGVMHDLLKYQNPAPVLFSLNKLTGDRDGGYAEDGIHVLDHISKWKAQILLNYVCNTPSVSRYPVDGTCCNKYFDTHKADVALFSVFSLAILLKGKPAWRLVVSASTIVATLFFCFLADRTQLFAKSYKEFLLSEFTVALFVCGVAGALSLRSSRPQLLSREQTDEWKGWMQALILIYHYTGASKVLWIYQLVRLAVAAYLFMTGFGHTVYFLQRQDFSFRRLATVLVRTNLISILLAYTMGTDSMFYYFAPLSSFWFVFVFLVLRFRCDGNNRLAFVAFKVLIATSVLSCLIKTPGILEKIFEALEITCRIRGSAREWRFRVGLDIYVVPVGILAGWLFVHKEKKRLHPMLTLATSLAVALYVAQSLRFAQSKEESNALHAILSPLAILAFVGLRNATQALRSYHSSLFAWLGRCSLETYVLQYHIWLAADAKGLLSTGLFDGLVPDQAARFLNFILLTPIFLTFSYRASEATSGLTNWFVAGNVDATLPVCRKSSENVPSQVDSPGLGQRVGLALLLFFAGNWLSWLRAS